MKLIFKDFPDGLKTRIGKKVVFYSIAVSTVVAFFATAAQLVWEVRVADDLAKHRFRQIENQHAPILTQSLWILDDQLILVHLSSILLIEDVAAIKLERPNALPLVVGAIPNESTFFVRVNKIALRYVHQGFDENLGELTVFLSMENSFGTIAKRMLLVLGFNFLKTLIVAVFLLLVFHEIIGRHLNNIANSLRQKELVLSGSPLKLDRVEISKKDELDLVVDAYNSSVLALRTALNDLEKSNEIILAAKEEAEEMNRTKTIFLGNISHELRTPLAAIQGFIGILADRLPVSEEKKIHYYARIKHNSATLLTLVEELLELTKIESGKISPVPTDFQLKMAIENTVHEFENQIEQKDLTVTIDISSSVPECIHSDPAMFSKIIRNVLGNAVKFTHKGSVSVRINRREGSAIEIEVEDTGKGVSENAREKIFSAFIQQDESIGRDYGGTGLGLAIARKTARALGGDVVLVRSIVNQGSVFRIELPIFFG